MKLSEKLIRILGIRRIQKMIIESSFEARTIPELVASTGVSRTGINYELKVLLNKGFIKKIKYGKRYVYIAISLDEITNLMQEAIDELNLRDLNIRGVRVKTSHQNEFIIHVGPSEILPAYQKIASKNKNTRIKAIQHHRSWFELTQKITQEQLVQFNNAIIKNKIILDAMLNESAYLFYKKEIILNPKKHKEGIESLKDRIADYSDFPDEFFNYDSEIWIFKNTTLIINWKEDVAIEITNQNITKFLSDMFDFVKMGSRKIDHNKIMKELLD